MPDHIFKEYLDNLENNPLTGNYHLLVVGTFNPEGIDNEALWFYGRPKNKFWYLLPMMIGNDTLHKADRNEDPAVLVELWKQYCNENKIVIVDILKSVVIDLPNYADANFANLQVGEYTLFDYQRALENAKFDGILFTWKGQTNNLIGDIKQQYINYFGQQGSHIMHMLTPSPAYRRSRDFKLDNWREEYKPISL